MQACCKHLEMTHVSRWPCFWNNKATSANFQAFFRERPIKIVVAVALLFTSGQRGHSYLSLALVACVQTLLSVAKESQYGTLRNG